MTKQHKHTLAELDSMLDQGLEIYKHYYYMSTGKNLAQMNVKMISPFRRGGALEKDPSFSIYLHRSKNTVFFKDQGNGRTGTHWQFVMDLFGCDFKDALEKVKQEILGFKEDGSRDIVRAFALHKKSKPQEVRAPITINHFGRDWNESDLNWFSSAGISRATLDRFECEPASSFEVSKDNKTYTLTESPENPIYVFDSFSHGRKKVYRPFSPESRFKWTSNLVAAEDVFGYKQIPKNGEFIFLLAGNRDTMSFWENIGFPCIALASESSNVPEWLLQMLRLGYKHVFVLYDNDDQGYRKAEQFEVDHKFISFNHLYRKFRGKEGVANDFVDMKQHNDVREFKNLLISNINSLNII